MHHYLILCTLINNHKSEQLNGVTKKKICDRLDLWILSRPIHSSDRPKFSAIFDGRRTGRLWSGMESKGVNIIVLHNEFQSGFFDVVKYTYAKRLFVGAAELN